MFLFKIDLGNLERPVFFVLLPLKSEKYREREEEGEEGKSKRREKKEGQRRRGCS